MLYDAIGNWRTIQEVDFQYVVYLQSVKPSEDESNPLIVVVIVLAVTTTLGFAVSIGLGCDSNKKSRRY
jgi:hypothetical protein